MISVNIIKQYSEFFKQCIRKPRFTGAIIPSSKYLADKMISGIDFKNTRCIVEYGAGTGVFTDKLVKSKNENTLIMVFEINYKFYKILKDKYKDENNVYVINDSAENIYKYLKLYDILEVDYVVSGLPFASLPQKLSDKILYETKKILKKDGKFITFQYTLLKKDFINQYFDNIYVRKEIKNIPPAYVLDCNN
ncbi:ribosomal RNA adenine methylase transferase [Gottschalkia purinilytica]|uniref:Ribosomal RNA adenine methylase transferase n=1 Tax=Gottschalkia purinilytica TaxID=1503 RepID=A0A0L0W6T7_GOTPU|nr:rRNA adenine N-6-methyltransferase family protein [Gottschalkia purinilytica]KNF07186.1 ribosomal RNA adenine methylase transferase [Gottschalkia purinilytica]